MARFGNQGPYSLENVYCAAHACATHAENMRDIAPEKLRRPLTPEMMAMFKRRGAERHNSMPIETPAGRFANATEAAEHFGITRQGVRYRIKAGRTAGDMYLQRRPLKRTEGAS